MATTRRSRTRGDVLVVEVSGRVSSGEEKKGPSPKSIEFTDADSGIAFSAGLTKRGRYSVDLPNRRSYRVSVEKGEEKAGESPEIILVLRAKKPSYEFDLSL